MSENFFEASLVSGYDLLFCHVYGPKSSSSQIIFQLQEKKQKYWYIESYSNSNCCPLKFG